MKDIASALKSLLKKSKKFNKGIADFILKVESGNVSKNHKRSHDVKDFRFGTLNLTPNLIQKERNMSPSSGET